MKRRLKLYGPALLLAACAIWFTIFDSADRVCALVWVLALTVTVGGHLREMHDERRR